MRAIQMAVTAAVLALTLTGCPKGGGTDGGSGGGTGGSTGGGTGGSTGGGSGGSTGGGSGGSTGGGSGGSGGSGGGAALMGSSCQTPIPLALGTIGSATISTMRPGFYYRVNVTGGDWLEVLSVAPGTSPIDTTVTLYDADGGALLASVDDAYPRGGSTDTTFQYRPKTTGPLCVLVEDYSTWDGDPTPANVGAARVLFSSIDAGTSYVNADTEPNDMTAQGQTGKTVPTTGNGIYAELYGDLGATDVDSFKFTSPDGGIVMTIQVPPLGWVGAPARGTNSYGSTLTRFTASVVEDSSGNTIASLAPPADLSKAALSLSVPVSPFTAYTVKISRPAAVAAGANDFYATTMTVGLIDNDREVEPNELDATATPITFAVDPNDAKLQNGFLLGTIPLPGVDNDVWSLTAPANGFVELSCSAQRDGSGLRGLNVEIHSATATIKNESETDAKDVVWFRDSATMPGTSVQIATAGTYYLKISATSQDSMITGNYYRCYVGVTSP